MQQFNKPRVFEGFIQTLKICWYQTPGLAVCSFPSIFESFSKRRTGCQNSMLWKAGRYCAYIGNGFGIYLDMEGFRYIHISQPERIYDVYIYIYIYMNGPETNVELYGISAAGTPGKAASKWRWSTLYRPEPRMMATFTVCLGYTYTFAFFKDSHSDSRYWYAFHILYRCVYAIWFKYLPPFIQNGVSIPIEQCSSVGGEIPPMQRIATFKRI